MRQREHASPRPAGSLADSAHATDSPQPVASLASSSAGGGSGPLAATALGTGADLAVALKGRLAHLKALHGGGSSSGGSCGSADDSAAALAGLHATGRTAVGGQGGSGKCSTCDDSAGACGDAALDLDGSAWYEDDEGDPYGADTLRPPWRRHEAGIAGWILAVFVLSMLLNAGTGAVASRRAARTHNRVAAGGVLAAAWQRPPPPPSPPLGRKRRSPSPPAPPLPPSPPAPPPAFCDVAPSHLARWRFSNLSAVFPAKPEHYSANLVARQGDGGRMPSYYNGVVPRNCLVGIQATYTCMQDDNPCNYSPTVSSSYCQTACNNDAQDCSQVAGLEGHPLAARACGLFRRSQPACTHIGFTLNREQQLRAFYKLNLCMAPPGPRPLPPATPPPPPPPAEYYYV